MKRTIPALLILAFVAIILVFVYKKPHFLYQQVENYTIQSIEQCYGNQKMEAKYEQFVYQIVRKMGISENISIRKMNYFALQFYGYHNACAVHPTFLCLFPIIAKPYIFISHGFFEDLPEDEQMYIIGHELAHIRERHVCYLPLVVILVRLVLLATWCFILIYYICSAKAYMNLSVSIQQYVSTLTTLIFIAVMLYVTNLGSLAYRRSIEWDADIKAVSELKCHHGAIALFERWEKIYKLPKNNGYRDLFSDHPSITDRIEYCKNNI